MAYWSRRGRARMAAYGSRQGADTYPSSKSAHAIDPAVLLASTRNGDQRPSSWYKMGTEKVNVAKFIEYLQTATRESFKTENEVALDISDVEPNEFSEAELPSTSNSDMDWSQDELGDSDVSIDINADYIKV